MTDLKFNKGQQYLSVFYATFSQLDSCIQFDSFDKPVKFVHVGCKESSRNARDGTACPSLPSIFFAQNMRRALLTRSARYQDALHDLDSCKLIESNTKIASVYNFYIYK